MRALPIWIEFQATRECCCWLNRRHAHQGLKGISRLVITMYTAMYTASSLFALVKILIR